MPGRARVYIAAITLSGAACIFDGLARWQSDDLARFLAYLALGLLASRLKVSLPAITGTMSVNFLFVLLGIAQLSLPETLAIGCSSAAVQCFRGARCRPAAIQIAFNASSMAVAIRLSYDASHSQLMRLFDNSTPVLLLVAVSTFFAANTISVAGVIALTERKKLRKVWRECHFWSFPYYLAGAAIAGLIRAASSLVGWQSALLVLPAVYFIYRSYRLYLGRLEAETTHVEEMASLHLRTIEALALAIDAKDYTTHDHLRRVQVYAVEIGRELGLDECAIQALRAASVLHDIGKLGVPEHIISKPGRLTPEEFEKMKIHPVVGAEILEQVKFPYAVVPIVRAHHERWDGSGYPDGLKGEQIPLGARILAAVDCLDALASDRQYRRALPLEEAMCRVAGEAGRSFDPRVVEVLKRRYVELDRRAQDSMPERTRLSIDMKVEKGTPAAGFEAGQEPGPPVEIRGTDFLASIAAARSEVQMLFELANDLGNSLSLDETLSVLAMRLKRMIPYDAIAIYIRREDKLIPEYVNGDNFRLFSSLEIPLGQGLSGWVAENLKPITNGNPSVEPGYLNDATKFSTLRSALAVPLEGLTGVLGVLALYHAEKDNFNRDHLRILLAITPKIALSIENALRYRLAESSATTDDLTGLPNARSLFLHLDGELARSKRAGEALGVLVCDLDGFKQVNDRFGHLEGNRVLREVAKALRDTCREYDYAARMGGDEFVLVSPGLKRADIQALICRLGTAVSEAGNVVCGEPLLSLSVGAALYPEDGTNAEQLLTGADRRMYKAKQWHKMLAGSGSRRTEPGFFAGMRHAAG